MEEEQDVTDARGPEGDFQPRRYKEQEEEQEEMEEEQEQEALLRQLLCIVG